MNRINLLKALLPQIGLGAVAVVVLSALVFSIGRRLWGGGWRLIFPSQTERIIARRYLYRFHSSPAVAVATAACAALALACNLYYFTRPDHLQTPLAGGMAILTPLLLAAVGLLNLFSAFSTVAVFGVMLGVAALTVVMAVTSGFQAEIQRRVIGVNAHILILKYGTDFSEYADVRKKVERTQEVVAAAPFVLTEMLIAKEGGAASGVLVKGIDVKLGAQVLDLPEQLNRGPDGQKPPVEALQIEKSPTEGGPPLPGAFVGRELQKKLKLKIGDRLRLVAPLPSLDGWSSPGESGEGQNTPPPRLAEFRLAGVFTAGFDEYDRRLMYVSLARAQQLVGQGDVVTGVEMRLRDADKARRVAQEIEERLGGSPYRSLDWEELNHNLFTALALQKAVLGLVLFLIVLVAAFNIVASLTMMVIDKTKEVAILKAMGMTSFAVAGVFRSAGMTIGISGTTLGLGMGMLVCAVVRRLGYLLDAKVYLIDKLPIQISPVEIALTGLATLLICFLATLYPALRAAGLPPVDGLRYE